jgi:hypothetical protein
MDLGIKLIPGHHPQRGGNPVDVSIIIAHRGAELGLWATIHSCSIELQASGLTYEFCIAVNGEEKLSDDLTRIREYLGRTGTMQEFVHVAEAMSPPSARQLATESANGKYLFFFDNHCLVNRGYFTRAIESMERYGIDVLHSTTKFFDGCETNYEYHLTLKRDFWTNKPYFDPVDPNVPYKVAMAGHGGFAVKRDFWERIGGYWPGFVGYGGEESYFDLKTWLFGSSVWLDPQMVHYHWAGVRSYARHFTPDYFRNMLMCANVIGGEQWMYTVFNSFKKFPQRKMKDIEIVPLFDILCEAQAKSQQHAKWLADKRVTTLDDFLAHCAGAGIRT